MAAAVGWPSLAALSAVAVQCKKSPMPGVCEQLRKKILKQNKYAAVQLDAFGKIPENLAGFTKLSMGDYGECVEITTPIHKDYKTQFCWAHNNIPWHKFLEDNTVIQAVDSCSDPTLDVKWSVCMPRSCSEKDIHNLLNLLPEHLEDAFVCRVSCRPTEIPYTVGFWIAMILLAVVVGLAVFASVVDHYVTLVMRYILCFSAVSNGRRIFAVPKSDKMVHGIDCIRFFSFTWVISGHFFGFLAMADNAYLLLNEMSELYYHVWMNAYYSVDSFFLLSGTMLSYMFIGSSNKNSITKPALWGMFYLHRYIRLTVPYAAYLLFYVVTLPHINTGPNEIVGLDEIQSCGGVWWANMLYINNIYRRPQCLTISWYLAADTQMYVFSPQISCPIHILTSPWRLICFVTFMLARQSGDDLLLHRFMLYLYEAFYIRIIPFLVGIVVGYILLKTRTTKLVLKKGLVIAMWAAAIAISLSALLTPYHYQRGAY
ncbi:hypothetical protein Aduo_011356 [Ancylostoma duodenale]